MECVEREGEGRWLVQVGGSDSKQLEMKVQCEQFISTFNPPLHTPSRHKYVQFCDQSQLYVVTECRCRPAK